MGSLPLQRYLPFDTSTFASNIYTYIIFSTLSRAQTARSFDVSVSSIARIQCRARQRYGKGTALRWSPLHAGELSTRNSVAFSRFLSRACPSHYNTCIQTNSAFSVPISRGPFTSEDRSLFFSSPVPIGSPMQTASSNVAALVYYFHNIVRLPRKRTLMVKRIVTARACLTGGRVRCRLRSCMPVPNSRSRPRSECATRRVATSAIDCSCIDCRHAMLGSVTLSSIRRDVFFFFPLMFYSSAHFAD